MPFSFNITFFFSPKRDNFLNNYCYLTKYYNMKKYQIFWKDILFIYIYKKKDVYISDRNSALQTAFFCPWRWQVLSSNKYFHLTTQYQCIKALNVTFSCSHVWTWQECVDGVFVSSPHRSSEWRPRAAPDS